MATYLTSNTNIDTICMGNDTNWDEIVQSVPKGIAAMSKLLNCASNGQDFNLDNIKKEHAPLMKHPESFRRTLEQITNDYYEAFVLAHKNMEQIQAQMDKVPDYIRYSIKITEINNSGNKTRIVYGEVRPASNQDVLIKLKKIKKIADNCLRMSTEVSQAFCQLGQLNQQVLLAITASHEAKEREIADSEKKKFEITKTLEEIDCRLKANDSQKNIIQEQMKVARHNVQLRKQKLEEALQLGVGDLLKNVLFVGLPYAASVKSARDALDQANFRLRQIQQEAKQFEGITDGDDFLKRVANLHVHDEKEISQDEMMTLVKKAMNQLRKSNSNWVVLIKNFTSINNYIKKETQKELTDFVEYAQYAQEDASIIDFMTDSINKSLECSIKTHHNAKMYVEFSNENIMQSLDDMQHYL